MARSNTGSTSNYFTTTSPVASGSNLHTIACWFRADSPTVDGGLVTITNPAGSSYSSLIFDGTNGYALGDNRLLLDASAVVAAGGTISTTGVWNHCAGVVAASNSRTVYLNGTAGTTNTSAATNAGLADMSIGAFKGSTSSVFSPINGAIAEVGVWDVALTASEIASLAKGASPLLIRPANLVSYIPLLGRGTERDWLRSAAVTTVGTMAQTAHPPGLKGPVDAFIPDPPAAGGGTPGTAAGATVTEQGSLVAGSATGAASGAAATVTLASSLIAGTATGAASAAAATVIEQESVLAGSSTGAAAAGAATVALNKTLLAGASTGAASAAAATVTQTRALVAGAATGAATGAAVTVTEGASLVAGVATGAAARGAATVTLNTAVIAGTASGTASAAGATVAEVTSLIAGSVSAGGTGNASGVTVSLAASLIAGTARGAALASGVTLGEAATLLAGSASGASGSAGPGTAAGATVSLTTSFIGGAGAGAALAPILRTFDQLDDTWDSTGITLDNASGSVLGLESAALASGAATVSAAASGTALTETVSLLAGAATGSTAPVVAGATFTAVTTLIAGSSRSDGPGMVSGTTVSVVSSLTTGVATGAAIAPVIVTFDQTGTTWDQTGATFDDAGRQFVGLPGYAFVSGAAIGGAAAVGVMFQTSSTFMGSPANVPFQPVTAAGAVITTVASLEAGAAKGLGWTPEPEGEPTWTNVAEPGDGWTVVPRPGGTWDKAA